MVSALISRIVILVFGTLYPAYKSYKAVNRRNAKEYVKWMMYWIVFALFTFVETFADLFVAWLPFYYEIKILFVLWLLSPATKGASILYKKFVHPALSKREKDIDTHLDKVTEQGYAAVLNLGSKGFNYATNVVLNTAIKGQAKLAENLKRSYSMSDVSDERQPTKKDEIEEMTDEDETDNRLIEESYQREINGEKDIDTTQQPRRRVKGKREDLENISEGEEEIKPTKKAYSHKEFRTSPDNERSTRPTSFNSPRLTRSSFNRLDSDSPRSSPKLHRNLKLEGLDYKHPSYTRSAPSTPVSGTPSSPSAFSSYSRYTRSTSTGSPSSPSPNSSSSWRSRSSYSFWK